MDYPFVLIVTSTYNDAPPQNAVAFDRWLSQLLTEKAASDETLMKDPTPTGSNESSSLIKNSPRGKTNPIRGVKFAVLGIGNSQWITYQTAALRFDEKLGELGGQRLLNMGKLDVDATSFEENLSAWKKQLLQSILNEFITFEEVSFVFDEVASGSRNSIASKKK